MPMTLPDPWADRFATVRKNGRAATHRQLRRFIIIGLLSASLDGMIYRLLLAALPVSIAKGASYLIGMIFSISSNYRWTFGQDGLDQSRLTRCVIVYLLSLGLNVAVNRAGLLMFGGAGGGAYAAFLMATGCSSVVNFAGLRSWAVRQSPG